MQSSTAALLSAVVAGIIVFALGYFYRGFKGARGTLKLAKSTVPAARKGYWSATGTLIKWGLFAAALLFVLITWTVRDVQEAGNATPAPSPSATR